MLKWWWGDERKLASWVTVHQALTNVVYHWMVVIAEHLPLNEHSVQTFLMDAFTSATFNNYSQLGMDDSGAARIVLL